VLIVETNRRISGPNGAAVRLRMPPSTLDLMIRKIEHPEGAFQAGGPSLLGTETVFCDVPGSRWPLRFGHGTGGLCSLLTSLQLRPPGPLKCTDLPTSG